VIFSWVLLEQILLVGSIIKEQKMVFKSVILLIISLVLLSCSNKLTRNELSSVDKIYFEPQEVFKVEKFISHAQDKTPYLAKNVNYAGIEKIRIQLESKLGKKLKNRGEAHITIITPPEYSEKLSPTLGINVIDEVADLNGIQQMPFELLCIGQGKLKEDPNQATYFIVISSKEVIELRRKISVLLPQKSNETEVFNYEDVYPHITLGYTDRDLHLQDGVIKDIKSCIYNLEPKK
jgi:2'-5' RNA ligase